MTSNRLGGGIDLNPYVPDEDEDSGRRGYDFERTRTRYIPTSSSRRDRPTSTTQTQTSTTSYTGERPEDFKQPEYDEGEIKRIARAYVKYASWYDED